MCRWLTSRAGREGKAEVQELCRGRFEEVQNRPPGCQSQRLGLWELGMGREHPRESDIRVIAPYPAFLGMLPVRAGNPPEVL